MRAYCERRQIGAFLASIQESVDRAARIVRNMLKFSRKADSVKTPVDIREILEKALELANSDYDLERNHDFLNIRILRDFRDGPLVVPAVGIEIEQVILNLLRNAAQAMGSNPPERPPTLAFRLRRSDGHAVLEVEDNGPGMEEAVRRRVFEPFFTTKAPGVGTGLGLSVSYMIITQNHHGIMKVDSEPGRGTCFTIHLPLETEDPRA
jgi:signal transduction histidine kinase